MKSTRRGFLTSTAGGAIGLAGTASAARTRRLIRPADLRYLGAFRMPAQALGEDAAWGRGLAHRVVRGGDRFLSITVPNRVYEVSAPRLARREPYPVATIVGEWGDISGDARYLDGDRGSGTINGLLWDARGSRLYWSYGDQYNTVSARDPSIGASRLNAATGRPEPIGAWKTGDRSCKMAMGGATAIPKWFADRYCAGRRIGAGFGGYFSIATTGPISMGPALCAVSADDCTPARNRQAVGVTDLVGYPFNANPYTQPTRAQRDTDYRTEFDGWNPRKGVGYWSWSDYIWQGGVWVDQPGLHGVLFFPTLGSGRTWYETSTLHAERATHWCYVYDPADLAAVATGRRKQWEIQARRWFPIRFPGLRYPLPGWANEPENMVVGVAHNPSTRRLYVSVRDTVRGHLVHTYGLG
jgi:hypothetical protein